MTLAAESLSPGLSDWPADISLPLLTGSLGDLLRRNATRFPDRPAVLLPQGDEIATITHAQLLAKAENVARWLAARCAPGDRIALWSRNAFESVVLQHGCALSGTIIAAIHGACYGVGLQQAACCDVRFASRDAKFCVPYVKRGLIAELPLSWQLNRLIGVGRTTDMLLSARVFGGEEALAIGLVNQLCEPEELFDRAFAYCRTIAAENSPWAMRMVKQQIYHDLMSASLTQPFDRAGQLLQVAVSGPDMREGITAFREKRPLNFPPLSPDLAKLDPWPEG